MPTTIFLHTFRGFRCADVPDTFEGDSIYYEVEGGHEGGHYRRCPVYHEGAPTRQSFYPNGGPVTLDTLDVNDWARSPTLGDARTVHPSFTNVELRLIHGNTLANQWGI